MIMQIQCMFQNSQILNKKIIIDIKALAWHGKGGTHIMINMGETTIIHFLIRAWVIIIIAFTDFLCALIQPFFLMDLVTVTVVGKPFLWFYIMFSNSPVFKSKKDQLYQKKVVRLSKKITFSLMKLNTFYPKKNMVHTYLLFIYITCGSLCLW